MASNFRLVCSGAATGIPCAGPSAEAFCSRHRCDKKHPCTAGGAAPGAPPRHPGLIGASGSVPSVPFSGLTRAHYTRPRNPVPRRKGARPRTANALPDRPPPPVEMAVVDALQLGIAPGVGVRDPGVPARTVSPAGIPRTTACPAQAGWGLVGCSSQGGTRTWRGGDGSEVHQAVFPARCSRVRMMNISLTRCTDEDSQADTQLGGTIQCPCTPRRRPSVRQVQDASERLDERNLQ